MVEGEYFYGKWEQGNPMKLRAMSYELVKSVKGPKQACIMSFVDHRPG